MKKKVFIVCALIVLSFSAKAQNIITIAGGGLADGEAATVAGLQPLAVAVDGEGNVYIADEANNLIRKVSPTGVITTFAGTGTGGFSGDGGPATAAGISVPKGVAVDAIGNVYIADGNGHIRKVNSAGIISSIAGNGTAGFSGDGGAATQAQFNTITV